MPGYNVTITGTFVANEYTLTYIVGGTIVSKYTIEYGQTIEPEEEPTKEGYTFSGWSDIPETMPAKNVTIRGSFTVNSYKLTYMLDGEVYKTNEVNAFACGDGSIRVYSALMDVMDDEELTAILGHELGHVHCKHTKSSIKNAYMASAARDVVASAGTYGAIAAYMLGDISEALVSAQYSQKNEYEADEQGCDFAIERGMSPYSMYNALQKLLELSQDNSTSIVAHMFADHPKTEKRMEKMKKRAENYIAKGIK